MQNVPTADFASASKVEYSSAAATSNQGMSSELFGDFMDYQANLHQDDFAPAPDLDTMAAQAHPTAVKAAKSEATTTTHEAAQTATQAEPEAVTPHAKAKAEANKAERAEDDAPSAQPSMEEMKDVKIEAQDFQAMKEQLKKYGLSDEDVAELEERVNSAQGLTWGSFVQFIASKMDQMNPNLEFTAGQKQQLMHFFQKMGFSSPDSEKLVGKLQAGEYDKVLSAMEKQLQSLDQSRLAGLDMKEVKAFMQELRHLQAESSAKDLGMTRLIGQAMQKARARILSQSTNGDANQNANADKAGSQATDMANAARLNPAQTGESQAKSAAENAERLIKTLNPEEQAKVVMDQAADKAAESMKIGNEKPTDHFLKQDAKSEQDAWSEFMGKLREDPASLGKSAKAMAETNAADTLAEGVAQARQTLNATLDKLDAPKVMRQVQDAVIKNMGQGQKRLSIQLEPGELGKLSIVLTSSSKGEVQATIRADNHEVARLLGENLESVRQALENEGLKVSKLEVQTQLPQFSGNEWQGENQHNLAREQQAMARQMGRWRSLRSEGAALGREAVESAVRALRGDSGLHVIA